MEKNLFRVKIILLCLILIIILFSGCVSRTSDDYYSKNNQDIIPIGIKAPEKAFFDDTIEFDVSNDYSNYKITSYRWDFHDGTDLIGKNVKHKYIFDNNFKIEYPEIYTVTLFTTLQDNSIIATKHQIKLYPKDFTFYLDENQLSKVKPDLNYEIIDNEIFNFQNQKELIYNLDEPVFLDECSWDLTLNVRKPLLLTIKDIKVTIYDEKGSQIDEKQIDSINFVGIKNSIEASGIINQRCTMKTMKISISSFSLVGNLKFIYGGKEPSNICFKFK